MSTVGTITPYEEVRVERSNGTATIATSIVAGVIVAAGALLAESLRYDDRQKKVIEQYREKERENRLQMDNKAPLVSATVTLKLRSMESFVRSAEGLGFGLLPLNTPHIPLEAQSSVTLTSKTGERLVVRKSQTGKLVVQTTGDLSSVQNVVKKNTLNTVRKYLGNRCKDVEIQQRPDGVSEFAGVENKTGPGGQAKITVQVKRDGGVKVDVSNIKGKRCDVIIQEIARAIEGECIKVERKGEYYQTVEERGRVRG